MTTRESHRKLALGTFLLVFAMLVFTLFAGHPNQGLLALSSAGRLLFCMGSAAGAVVSLYLLRLSADPVTGTSGWKEMRSRGISQWAMRLVLAFLAMTAFCSLVWFGFLHRVALYLDGPVHRESARLQRPLSTGSPAWCGRYTTVRTESGDTGSLCMERIGERSELMGMLGCVPLDSTATIQITQTFLGPVGSLVEVVDESRKCARTIGKQ